MAFGDFQEIQATADCNWSPTPCSHAAAAAAAAENFASVRRRRRIVSRDQLKFAV
jgi:hypothetical protein